MNKINELKTMIIFLRIVEVMKNKNVKSTI